MGEGGTGCLFKFKFHAPHYNGNDDKSSEGTYVHSNQVRSKLSRLKETRFLVTKWLHIKNRSTALLETQRGLVSTLAHGLYICKRAVFAYGVNQMIGRAW